MHALYSNHIGYNETPTLPVLNGPPSWVVRSASKKRPIRSSIQTVLTETKVSYNNDTWLVIMLSYIFKFENNI